MNLNNHKIEDITDNFIKQILELDNSKNNLENKLVFIDKLVDNLIDFCIKQKIFYYVENKISYNNIVNNFKSYLVNYIKNLIDPSNKIIDKYIDIDSNSNWDNVSDINALMLKKFKNLNETFEKNVSFNDSNNIFNYNDNDDGFEFNYNSGTNLNKNLSNISDIKDDTKDDTNKLSLYIKILINQNKHLIEFTSKLNEMCKVLSNQDIKYKKNNPYD